MQFQKAVRPLRGEISVPGDKSISLMLILRITKLFLHHKKKGLR